METSCNRRLLLVWIRVKQVERVSRRRHERDTGTSPVARIMYGPLYGPRIVVSHTTYSQSTNSFTSSLAPMSSACCRIVDKGGQDRLISKPKWAAKTSAGQSLRTSG